METSAHKPVNLRVPSTYLSTYGQHGPECRHGSGYTEHHQQLITPGDYGFPGSVCTAKSACRNKGKETVTYNALTLVPRV